MPCPAAQQLTKGVYRSGREWLVQPCVEACPIASQGVRQKHFHIQARVQHPVFCEFSNGLGEQVRRSRLWCLADLKLLPHRRETRLLFPVDCGLWTVDCGPYTASHQLAAFSASA